MEKIQKDKKELSITDKQKKGLELLVLIGKPICAKQAITDYKEQVQEKGFDIAKINGLNATLASLASKGLVEKKTGSDYVYDNKLLTHYVITELGLEMLEKKSN